jgi:hypothetical protein
VWEFDYRITGSTVKARNCTRAIEQKLNEKDGQVLKKRSYSSEQEQKLL